MDDADVPEMEADLTKGSILKFHKGEDVSGDIWIQVQKIRVVDPNNMKELRYALKVHDTVHHVETILNKKYNDLVRSQGIIIGSIIQVTQVEYKSLQGNPAIVLGEVEVLQKDCEMLGDTPTQDCPALSPLPPPDSGAVAARPPANTDANAGQAGEGKDAEEKAPPPKAGKEEQPKQPSVYTLQIEMDNYENLKMKVKASTKWSKIAKTYAKKIGKRVQVLRFLYEGDPIKISKDNLVGDVIKDDDDYEEGEPVTISVVIEQLGG